MSANKTGIVTGAQLGIGAGLVEDFLQAGYNVVGTSLTATTWLSARSKLALVDADISKRGTAEKTVEAAVFYAKPFKGFIAYDFNVLASANLLITKGGPNKVTPQLAFECAKEGMRFDAVAPGVLETLLHKHDPKNPLTHQQPMKKTAIIRDGVDAVTFFTRARKASGKVLHFDGGAHVGVGSCK